MIYTENKRSSNPNPKNVIIVKTKVLLPQTQVILAEFSNPVYTRQFCWSQNLFLFSNRSLLSVLDEHFSRNLFCALNYISTFSLITVNEYNILSLCKIVFKLKLNLLLNWYLFRNVDGLEEICMHTMNEIKGDHYYQQLDSFHLQINKISHYSLFKIKISNREANWLILIRFVIFL